MDSIKLPTKKINAKRPGALVGIITEVSEYLRLLYITIGKRGEHSVVYQPLGFPEIRSDVACSICNGAGFVNGEIDPNRMIVPELSLKQGAVLLWAGTNCRPVAKIEALAKLIGIDFEKPLAEQDERFVNILLYGYDKEPVSYVHKKKQFKAFYRGCVSDLRYMRDAGTNSKGNLRAINFFSRQLKCQECNGYELNSGSLALTLQDQSFEEASRLPIPELLLFIRKLSASLDEHDRSISSAWREEMELRLIYLNKIGLRALPSAEIGSKV